MNTYAIIAQNTGILMDLIKASDAVEACRVLDTEIAGEPYEYEVVCRETDLKENGYIVFMVPDDFECEVDQDEGWIDDLKEQGEFVAYVRFWMIEG